MGVEDGMDKDVPDAEGVVEAKVVRDESTRGDTDGEDMFEVCDCENEWR